MSAVSKPKDKVLIDRLFRYRRLDTEYGMDELDRAINDRCVFVSSLSSVNDPFDFKPFLSNDLKGTARDISKSHPRGRLISKEKFDELRGVRTSRAEYRRGLKKQNPYHLAKIEHRATVDAITRHQSQTRLACFSETNQSIPMWAHYSSHSGFCIEYKLKLNDLNAATGWIPMPVKYSNDRPEINVADVRVFTGRSKDSSRNKEIKNVVFEQLYLTKSSEWSYEKEWRIFSTDPKPPAYEYVPTLIPVGIYLGMNTKKDSIEEIVKRYAGRILLSRAVPETSRFGFNFVRL